MFPVSIFEFIINSLWFHFEFIPASSEIGQVLLSNNQSTISSSDSASQVGNMSLMNGPNDVNKIFNTSNLSP